MQETAEVNFRGKMWQSIQFQKYKNSHNVYNMWICVACKQEKRLAKPLISCTDFAMKVVGRVKVKLMMAWTENC